MVGQKRIFHVMHDRWYKHRELGIGNRQAVNSTILRIEKGEIIFLLHRVCRDPMQEVCDLSVIAEKLDALLDVLVAIDRWLMLDLHLDAYR